MLNHIKIRYKTRRKQAGEVCLCERCERRIGVDVHHIKSSFRGKRKESEDGSDIILLCRSCHEWVHANNNRNNRLRLLEKVQTILSEINEDVTSDNLSCM